MATVRTLMLTTGLPERYEPLMLTFCPPDGTHSQGRLVAIGDDSGTTLYCDLADGHVLSADDAGRLPTRFMNSGIAQLARCLAEYERARQESRDASTDQDDARVASLFRSRLAQIDPAALADTDHWWSVVVEQMESGLL